MSQPRLFVLTDISSLESRVREPDDGQSMIRLMLYSNEFDIEGLAATSNMGHGWVTRPELIRRVIKAYSQVMPSLALHDPRYPSPERLMQCVVSGNPVAGPDVPVEDCVGRGKDTEVSERIIACAERPDDRPLWITVWGGTADLAQALWCARGTRTSENLAHIISRLRIHAVNDQDTTASWIRREFPDLFYITRGYGIRGMYRGGEESLCTPEWVEANVRARGPLGELYPNYDGGDIWSEIRGLKEGDTPSYLALVPCGPGDPDHPDWGSWGGRLERIDGNPLRWKDAVDEWPGFDRDRSPLMAATYRWRPDFQADFRARLDHCVNPPDRANHAPVARVKCLSGPTITVGGTAEFDASDSSDPDGDALSFSWWLYKEAGTCRGLFELRGDGPRARLVARRIDIPGTLHVMLTVRDSGEPPLAGYARIILTA